MYIYAYVYMHITYFQKHEVPSFKSPFSNPTSLLIE